MKKTAYPFTHCYCDRCGIQHAYLAWNMGRDGSVRLGVYCKHCNSYIAWIKQTPENLALAPSKNKKDNLAKLSSNLIQLKELLAESKKKLEKYDGQ